MTQETSKPRGRFLRNLGLAGAATFLSLGAICALGSARAEEPAAKMERVWGGGFGGGFGGGPFGGHGLDRMLRSVDATTEQREKILGFLDEARTEIRPQVWALHEKRDELQKLLAAETIDREAFEKLRQELLVSLDSVSKQALEAFLGAAETLTPEQRAELREQRRHGWGRGPGWWD